MDAVNFTSAARIRVLLVPVGPIKKATFERHVKMLRQHNSVKLEEVWMGPRTENCKEADDTVLYSLTSHLHAHRGRSLFCDTLVRRVDHQPS